MSNQLKRISLSEVFQRIFIKKIPSRRFKNIEYNEEELEGNDHALGNIKSEQARRLFYIWRHAAKFIKHQRLKFLNHEGKPIPLPTNGEVESKNTSEKLKYKNGENSYYQISGTNSNILDKYLESEKICLELIDDLFWEAIISEYYQAAYQAANPNICYGWLLVVTDDFDEKMPPMFKQGHFLNDYLHCLEEIFTGKSKLACISENRLPDVMSGETVMGKVDSQVIKQLNSLLYGINQILADVQPEGVTNKEEFKKWRRNLLLPDYELYVGRNNRLHQLSDLTYDIMNRLTLEYLDYPPEVAFKFCRGWQVVLIPSEEEMVKTV